MSLQLCQHDRDNIKMGLNYIIFNVDNDTLAVIGIKRCLYSCPMCTHLSRMTIKVLTSIGLIIMIPCSFFLVIRSSSFIDCRKCL